MSKPTEGTAGDIQAKIAENVAIARKNTSFSRRELSQKSGVSERYLAQLEAGKGNVSVVLLEKIAISLGTNIENLVSSRSPCKNGNRDIQDLIDKADAGQRKQILRILRPNYGVNRKANRIAMIGLRGAGKSTLGALAAKSKNIEFVELNHEIERASGMAIHEVFALYDHQGYRRLEYQSLERVAGAHDRLILAVGGGVVSSDDTYEFLLENFHTIWLQADADDHLERVRAQGDERPMAGHRDAMKELKSLLVSRDEAYRRADALLNTSGVEVEESLGDLLGIIDTKKYLNQG